MVYGVLRRKAAILAVDGREMTCMRKTPVLLMTYRKPEFLSALHAVLLDYRPPKLYVAHNPASAYDNYDEVMAVRRMVAEWRLPFPVEYVFHESHFPINESFHKSLDYVFSVEDNLIVLEDDTLPSPDFFTFCNTMIERHSGDDSVGRIVGCTLGARASRHFSVRVPFSVFNWGWASWAGKWKQARATALPWGNDSHLQERLSSANEFYSSFLPKLDMNTITWDVRLAWAQLLNNSDVLLPSDNLVVNRGFGSKASFTVMSQHRAGELTVDAGPVPASEPWPLVKDLAFTRDYEEITAGLIRDILAAKGVLARYGLE